jgi:hypothetical protein
LVVERRDFLSVFIGEYRRRLVLKGMGFKRERD